LGKTLVMVTHDPRAASVAKRLVKLEKGRLVDDVLPARERLTVRA
jgi:putative ABC transport system ATP-binding protein